MEKNKAKEEILKLRKQLEIWANKYYDEDNPEVSDYEYEMQMALVNKKLDPDIETLFMVSRSEYVYLSSSIVKEIALNGGSIDCFVPKIIEKSLKNKIRGGL